MRFSLRGVLLGAVGTPLGALTLLFLVARRPTPDRGLGGMSQMRMQRDGTSRCCSRDEFVQSPPPVGGGRRYLLGLRFSKACSLSRGDPLSIRGALPSRPCAGQRFLPQGPQGLERRQRGRTVSGPSAFMKFVTSWRWKHSVSGPTCGLVASRTWTRVGKPSPNPRCTTPVESARHRSHGAMPGALACRPPVG